MSEVTNLTTLPSGLTVVVRRSAGNPTVSVHGLVRAGRVDDPPELPGLGSFAVDMLESGTQRHDKFELAALLEDNGIELGFAPGREAFSFHARALSEDFARLLDVLSEMLLDSTFPAAEVEKERGQIISDLLDSLHSTRAESSIAAREMLYGPVHPFSGRLAGTPESVRVIGHAAIADWYSQHFSLNGAVLTIVGDVDAGVALEAARARLGEFSAPPVPQREALLASAAQVQDVSGQRRHLPIAEKSNASLVWVAPGPSKRDPLWPAYFAANFIFGGDFYSRLNARLRVKEGLTYGSGSRFANGYAAGPLLVMVQTSARNVEAAITATVEELALFSTDGATADELALAKSYLTGNFPVQLSTNAAVAAVLADSLYLERGIDYPERYRAIIEGVTLAQVNEIAARQYDPSKMGLVTAGSLPQSAPDGSATS